MTHQQFMNHILKKGYLRVERDDRLLDVFPTEIREKGVELWERWDDASVTVLRLRLPFTAKKMELFQVSRNKLEEWLTMNEIHSLAESELVGKGEDVVIKC